MRRCSFGETIGASRKFLSRVEQDRQCEVNNGDNAERPKPSWHATPRIMPDSSCDDAGESHRQHEFPGEIHDLVDASPRQRCANPDVNKKQDRQLREKPNVRWNEFERADW